MRYDCCSHHKGYAGCRGFPGVGRKWKPTKNCKGLGLKFYDKLGKFPSHNFEDP